MRLKRSNIHKLPWYVTNEFLKKVSPFMSDKLYLKILFRFRVGYSLNLNNPITYNEKLQWLKLNYRKPIMKKMVDKYEVKHLVSSKIGQEYVIPTLGVWDNFNEINFNLLPNQFVLKTTHDQGGVVICKNKITFDYKKAENKLNKHLKRKHFYLSREWPYKDVKPRIIAEQYMEDDNGEDLKDYKFFCFNGDPKVMFIATDRQSGNVKFNFYDMNFNPLNIVQTLPQSKELIEKPIGFEKMIELSKKLSAGLPHVRVDFYEINGRIYFGELTFFHHGGLHAFHPEKWDKIFGDYIDLSVVDKQ